MSEQIGVLELEIRDNAQSAGKGLDSLADGLKNVRGAAGKNLGLENVGTQVTNLSKIVNEAIGTSTTIKNIASLFNSISNFSKLGKIDIDVQPFINLKNALGDGIKIGQVGTQLRAMRNALDGNWNASGATTAISMLVQSGDAVSGSGTAKKIGDLASSLNKFKTAYEAFPKNTKKLDGIMEMMREQLGLGGEVINEPSRPSFMKLNLQQFAEKKKGSAGFEPVKSAVETASAATEELRVRLEETKDKITSVIDNPASPAKTSASIQKIKKDIDDLLASLNKVSNPKGKGFSNIVDIMTGVARPNTNPASEAAKTFEKYFAEQDAIVRAAEEGRERAKAFANIVGSPTESIFGSYAEQVEAMTGVSGLGGKSAGSSASAMMLPAKDSQFGFAVDEIRHYSDLLSKSKADMEFWSGEYDKIQNQIKYNGSTEERMGALGQAEQSFYAAMEGVKKYEEALAEAKAHADNLSQAIFSDAKKQQEAYDNVANSIRKVGEEAQKTQYNFGRLVYNPATGQYGPDTPTDITKRAAEEAEYRTAHIKKIIDMFRGSSEPMQQYISKMYGFDMSEFKKPVETAAAQVGDQMQPANSAAAETGAQMQTVSQASEEASEKLEEVGESAKKAGGLLASLKAELTGTHGAMKKLFPTLTGLAKRFSALIKYRALRTVLRHISAGFTEGLKNVYKYSEAVGTALAPAMDSATAMFSQFKNSIGAAVAPIVQAAIPLINQLVSVAIEAINWVNQLFALLAGQSSWTRALPVTTKAFDEQKKAAKGAGGAMKDLLADWDELNIIQSQGGGGGGGAATAGAVEYSKMFEEVNHFNEDVRSFIDSVKEQFGDVWSVAKKIGTAVLGWKVSSVFSGIIGSLLGLVSAGAIIGLVFDISTILNKTYMRTGNVGWLVADVLTTLIGGTLAKKVLGNVLGGTLAKVAIPLTLAVSALASIHALVSETDVSALSERGLLTALNAGLKGGAAAGITLHSLGGVGLLRSVGAGAGFGIATFGATVGIKAIAEVVQNRELTADTIKENFLSAGAIGAGITLAELALGGTTMAALTLGGGAALFTVGALFAIEAIIASKPKAIRWGDYEATHEEIEAFVKNDLVRVSPDMIIELVDPVVQVADEAKKNLTADVNQLKLNAKRVLLGYNNEEVRKDLMQQVTDIVADFNKFSSAQQQVIETGILLVPSADPEGDKGVIDKTSAAWTLLNQHMADLGQELSQSMERAYKAELGSAEQRMELESINRLTEMVAKVTSAVTQGQAWAEAQRGLKENLGNLSEGSFSEMLSVVEDYKKEVVDAATKAYDSATDAIAGQMFGMKASMENALELAKGNVEDEKYLAYKAAYEELEGIYKSRQKGRDDAIEKYWEDALDDETVDLIKKAFLSVANGIDVSEWSMPDLSSTGFYEDILKKLLTPEGNINTSLLRSTLTDAYDTILEAAFQDNYGYVKSMLDTGLINYSDLFGDVVPNMVQGLRKLIGTNGQYSGLSEEFDSVWADFIGAQKLPPIELPELKLPEAETPEIDYDLDITDGDWQGPSVDMSNLNNAMTESTQLINTFKEALLSIDELGAMYGGGYMSPELDLPLPTGKVATPYTLPVFGKNVNNGQNGEVEITGEVSIKEGEMASSVQKGMAADFQANRQMYSDMLAALRQIAAKDFSVKITPTASMGFFGLAAASNAAKVTGDVG